MVELLSPKVLYAAFGFAALAELYFFMMQRSALEISRAAEIDPKRGRLMLPLWYSLLWPIRLVKWAAAVAIGITVSWWVAAALLIIPFVISGFVPIPHSHFIRLFQRRVNRDLASSGGEKGAFFDRLDRILDRAEALLSQQ